VKNLDRFKLNELALILKNVWGDLFSKIVWNDDKEHYPSTGRIQCHLWHGFCCAVQNWTDHLV